MRTFVVVTHRSTNRKEAQGVRAAGVEGQDTGSHGGRADGTHLLLPSVSSLPLPGAWPSMRRLRA